MMFVGMNDFYFLYTSFHTGIILSDNSHQYLTQNICTTLRVGFTCSEVTHHGVKDVKKFKKRWHRYKVLVPYPC